METLQELAGIGGGNEYVADCRAGHAGGTQFGPPDDATYDFLRHQFQPKTLFGEKLVNKQAIENAFYLSLWHVCQLYGFDYDTLVKTNEPYPFAIGETLDKLNKVLHQKYANQQIEALIIQDEHRLATIGIRCIKPLKYALFYIPLQPLIELKKQVRPSTYNLVRSIVHFLLVQAKFPGIGAEASYMHWQYELQLDQFVEYQEELREEENSNQELAGQPDYKAEWKRIMTQAKKFEQACSTPIHGEAFADRLKRFKPKNEWDTLIFKIANGLYALGQAYPDSSIDTLWQDVEVETGEGRVAYMGETKGFVWHFRDWFYDPVIESINVDLQETELFCEPTQIQLFDTPQATISFDFTYSDQLFSLVGELIDQLEDQLDKPC